MRGLCVLATVLVISGCSEAPQPSSNPSISPPKVVEAPPPAKAPAAAVVRLAKAEDVRARLVETLMREDQAEFDAFALETNGADPTAPTHAAPTDPTQAATPATA